MIDPNAADRGRNSKERTDGTQGKNVQRMDRQNVSPACRGWEFREPSNFSEIWAVR